MIVHAVLPDGGGRMRPLCERSGDPTSVVTCPGCREILAERIAAEDLTDPAREAPIAFDEAMGLQVRCLLEGDDNGACVACVVRVRYAPGSGDSLDVEGAVDIIDEHLERLDVLAAHRRPLLFWARVPRVPAFIRIARTGKYIAIS